MRLSFSVTYDTENGQFIVGGDSTVHSGSSYLRIKHKDKQIGSIGSHILPYPSPDVKDDYNHLIFSILKDVND